MEEERYRKKMLRVKGLHIEQSLGKGSFATVYLCRKQFSRKKFAAKVIELAGDEQIRWQTENEIHILKEVNQSRHIVRIHGVVREDQTITCLLEYISGPSFIDGICKWPRFSENDVMVVMKQLLKALSYCHSKRIIHRDISHENLIWVDVPTTRKPNTEPLLKLIDFNLARIVPEETTIIAADSCGNQIYMAPESLQETPVASYHTDVWSAGVIMFLLLGGYPPFWNDNYNHLVDNIMEANYTLPEHLWSHVSISGKDILTKALRENLNERPSAEELLAYKWFKEQTYKDKQNINNITFPSPKRIKSFFDHIEREREMVTHRRYTLTIEERVAFIPADYIFSSVQCNDIDKNNNTSNDNNNNSKLDENCCKKKTINTHKNVNARNSIQGLVIKYERLSLESS